MTDSARIVQPTMSSRNGSCFNFTKSQIEIAIITRPTIATAGALACLIAVTVIVASKAYYKFNHRLVLYLMIATIGKAFCLSLALIPISHDNDSVTVREGWEEFCIATGFLAEASAWVEHFVIGWIAFYFIVLVTCKHYTLHRAHELLGIVVCILLPVIFSSIPFIHNMYGLAGLWCWIKLTGDDCNSKYNFGVGYQFGLFYGPFVILIFFSLFSILVVLISLCKSAIRSKLGLFQSMAHQQALKEAMPLLIYPIIYTVIFGLQTANRVYYTIAVSEGKPPYFPLWMTQIIVDPGRTLYPPLAFLLHPNTLKNLICRRQGSDTTDTYFVVSKEWPFSEEDSLVIRGNANTNYSSSQDFYKNVFEPPNVND